MLPEKYQLQNLTTNLLNTDFEIIIVGGGPAGLSTWLFLHQYAPHLAAKTVLIEKQAYPRKKLCGGGISTPGRDLLLELNFSFDFDYMPIRKLKIKIENEDQIIDAPPGFVVVDRAIFDHALAKAALKRGVSLRPNESFTGFERDQKQLVVKTDKDQYQVKALIAADGANSKVRKSLKLEEPTRLCRLLETYATSETEHNGKSQIAAFDFSAATQSGLQGYTWKFPCIKDGKVSYNAGIFDSQTYPNKKRVSIKEVLNATLASDASDFEGKLQSHPIRYFSGDATFSKENVLLTGDAAGVEPALGEGISTSIAYGKMAALALQSAFANGDFSFTDYKNLILKSPLGKQLNQQVDWAKQFYANDQKSPTVLKKYFFNA